MTLDGGNLLALLQVSAAVIVGGGTLGAILLQTPMPVFIRGVKMLMWVFFPPRDQREDYLRLITDWLRIARHQFVLALDPIAEQQTDPFLKQGLRLVVDGVDALANPRRPRIGDLNQGARGKALGRDVRGGGRLCPDGRHSRRGDGADHGHVAPRRPVEARQRHRHRLCRDGLRRRRGQSAVPADRRQAQGDLPAAPEDAGDGDRGDDRHRHHGKPAAARNAAARYLEDDHGETSGRRRARRGRSRARPRRE